MEKNGSKMRENGIKWIGIMPLPNGIILEDWGGTPGWSSPVVMLAGPGGRLTNGYVKKYTNLNLDWVKYLGIVIGSDEARNTSQVVELLEWLSAIGLKKICLYDQEDAICAVEADPDLLLIYGWPVRCHLGFPAWRIRYTEMA
ncbi:uncharacterized protein LOC110913174 [Helianthus annuus]|uniref:uncharacterized protein LOC110913174 n=1 Tax=Helianthus annuus TaxID=4232 RepID=UPI0016531C13|nr:uncharacterized protein LOC110913174 [Helianthus annuus]